MWMKAFPVRVVASASTRDGVRFRRKGGVGRGRNRGRGREADAPFASIRLPRTGPTALHLLPAFGSLGMNARASTRDGVRLPMGWCCEVPALLRDL